MKIDVVPSLAVLQLCPFFDVMIGPINGERQLLHVVGIGPMLRSLCTCNTSRFGFAAAPHLCFIRTHLCTDAILLYFHRWRSLVFAAAVPPI